VNDGEAIKLLPYTGPTAKVKLNAKEGWKVRAQLQSEGLFVAFPEDTDALLVPGVYQVSWSQAQYGEKKTENGGDQYPVSLYGRAEKGVAVQIKEGQNNLAFGPPFQLDFAAARSATDAGEIAISDAYLVGAWGEHYRALNTGSNGESNLTCFVRAAGKEQEVAKLSYG
jgi:hypothetical protein